MSKYSILLLIAIAFVACKHKSVETATEVAPMENTVELTEAQLKNAKIETGKIQKRAISSLLKVNGKIDVPPQNMISVSAPMGGYLKSTHLLEGMHVSKGEVIATMEDQQYIQLQQDYLTAKAYLESGEKEFNRQKDLNQSKASSDKLFETTQAQFSAQKVLVKSLSEKLKLIGVNPDNLNETTISRSVNILSPIDGYVSTVKMNMGKYASPTDVLFELVNPADIHLALTVFEKDINKLFIGQKITAYNNTPDHKKYKCEIILIGKDISAERAITVHCHFMEYDKSLIPGMFMNAEVEISTNDAYVVPDEAIVMFEGKQYVFMKVGDNKFSMKEVTTKNAEGGFTQVIFDDTTIEQEHFVLKGAYTLLMKMKNTEE
ncbi:MAG TPA: efflux RND transporter periplasmic adaptor subunit [Bacteroidia bacterium]|jgi:cobalt-zinc-cadmium efflux system membrane fusion protein|nr:efflux RND transporter periplasmic adaptor subunit [Bacteroidia bacterium]